MYGVFTMKYGKAYLVQQCKTIEEAEKKCEELDPKYLETESYFVMKC
jgi:hypothetical protein